MRVMLGVPTTRGFSVDYIKSLWGTRLRGEAHWYAASGLAIDVARNIIVRRALDAGCDFLLMHDSDATWHPDAIARLVELNLPIVSAVVYQRRFPTVPFIGLYADTKENGDVMYSFRHAAERVIEVALSNNYEPGEETEPTLFDKDVIEEVDAVGSHFVCIRRDVLESIEPPHYLTTHPPLAGEDFYFCRKAKEAGFPIYVNYAVHTGHIAGDGVVIGLRDFMLYSYREEDDA